MPRSQVISSLISKYDKVVNGSDRSAIELAVFKIAICQLVDAAFSGGGGGGGTTIGTVSDGIDGSIDINTIIARLTSIDTNRLTQANVEGAIQSAVDIDTIITRLTAIQTNTAGGGGGGGTTIATVTDGINASVDIDSIITRSTSLDTGKLTQYSIEAAIQSAADIDTIIARLTSITSNTSHVVTTYSHSTLSITDVGVVALSANLNRKGAVIINRSSTNPVDLFFAASGTHGSGLPLVAGQSYEINDTNLYTGVIRAITSGGTTVILAIAEGV